jgi:hypothetical protein
MRIYLELDKNDLVFPFELMQIYGLDEKFVDCLDQKKSLKNCFGRLENVKFIGNTIKGTVIQISRDAVSPQQCSPK